MTRQQQRKNLVVYQIECKRKVVQELKDELQKLHDELSACQIDDIKRQQIERELESSFDNAEHSAAMLEHSAQLLRSPCASDCAAARSHQLLATSATQMAPALTAQKSHYALRP